MKSVSTNPHIGTCGLCRKPDTLQDSHLLPAALYKLIENPVVITKNKAFKTSRQVSSHFLCRSCEQRFSKYGENYILSQCAQPNGQFKLRDLLKTATPTGIFTAQSPTGKGTTHEVKYYNVQPLLGSNTDKYLYFAASVFWRASAHNWGAAKLSVKIYP